MQSTTLRTAFASMSLRAVSRTWLMYSMRPGWRLRIQLSISAQQCIAPHADCHSEGAMLRKCFLRIHVSEIKNGVNANLQELDEKRSLMLCSLIHWWLHNALRTSTLNPTYVRACLGSQLGGRCGFATNVKTMTVLYSRSNHIESAINTIFISPLHSGVAVFRTRKSHYPFSVKLYFLMAGRQLL